MLSLLPAGRGGSTFRTSQPRFDWKGIRACSAICGGLLPPRGLILEEMALVLSTLSHIIDRKASNRVVTRLRALLRSNEFYLIPLALVIGVATGAIVTVMSLIAQVAHVLIYGIPIDVRLSANAWVNPIIALIAPACGGLILWVMEWLRRRWKIAAAVDPVEANALRGGRLSMRDSIVSTNAAVLPVPD